MSSASLRVAVALAVLTSPALADPEPAGPMASADGAGIAKPAPDASPTDVERAKQVADKAKLTPIITHPETPTRPAFLLYAEIDIPIVATGTVFALARLTKTQPAFCAPLCTDQNAGGLNAVDKITAGFYSAGWAHASDYMLYGLFGASGVLLFADEGVLGTLNDGVVIGEATLSATAVASIMTLAAGRPRPFLFSTKAPLSVRESGDAGLSFLSSHTAEAFALATSLFVAERRLHPTSKRPYLVLGVGLGVGSLIATARVMSGYHFISDVVGGAVVGSSLGVLIASVHGSPVSVVPVVNDTPAGAEPGVGISGRF
jgi:membrane-associated phospholipid phosphatase